MKFTQLAVCFVVALTTAVASAQPDTTFTYQGVLEEDGSPVNDAVDIAFALWDAPSGGTQIGAPNIFVNVPVVDGKFTMQLDFGAEAFEDDRWLEIFVNAVSLTPRTAITHAPYSIFSSHTRGIHVSRSGFVGIGTSNPVQQLHVRGQDLDLALRIQHRATFDFWQEGIGNTSKNLRFFYNGNWRADISSIDGAYTQSSDRRLKQQIKDLPPVLDKVGLLKPASYFYKDSLANAPRSFGFIAQDVEPLFPDLVRESDEGSKGLVYDGFAVISIKAVQELDTKVKEIAIENAKLRNANDALNTRLDSLEQLVKRLSASQPSMK